KPVRAVRQHILRARKQTRTAACAASPPRAGHAIPAPKENPMKALDVMVHDVVTVSPQDDIADVIRLLAEHDISALPVVDDDDHVVGVISEADLIHREEVGTGKHRPWWLEALTPASTLAKEFAKSHGRRVCELMSTDIVSASEDTPLGQIATLLEKH